MAKALNDNPRAARKGRGAMVYAIDPHNDVKELEDLYGAIKTHDALLRNLSDGGVRQVVQPVRETSHQARSKFADRSVDLIFINVPTVTIGVLNRLSESAVGSIRGGLFMVPRRSVSPPGSRPAAVS
jgi:hypothetical protein